MGELYVGGDGTPTPMHARSFVQQEINSRITLPILCDTRSMT